jgi:hypothetical protein
MHKFFLRNDMPPEYLPDFEKYELYVYMPDIKIDAGSSYGTKFSEPIVKKGSKELQKLKQVGELIIDFKSLAGKDIAYGHYGEIIVSEKALELFKDNNLTGFQEQAVRNWKDSKIKTGEKYFQLISTYSMPPVSAKTKIVKYFPTKLSFLFSTFVYIEDHILYYDKSISSISDFNTSFELFGDKGGDLYAPQNLWIVSNKVMRIMINDLNQHKRDFVPVILISEKGNEK